MHSGFKFPLLDFKWHQVRGRDAFLSLANSFHRMKSHSDATTQAERAPSIRKVAQQSALENARNPLPCEVRLPRKSIQIPSVCCRIRFTGKNKITVWMAVYGGDGPFTAPLRTIKCIQRRPESALLIANLKSALLPSGANKSRNNDKQGFKCTPHWLWLGCYYDWWWARCQLGMAPNALCFIHIQSYQQSNGSEFIGKSTAPRDQANERVTRYQNRNFPLDWTVGCIYI